VYNLTAAGQVQPMWKMVNYMVHMAQKSNTGMPGFNQNPAHQVPKHAVAIDEHGCEQ
jgi:hypothetical protein